MVVNARKRIGETDIGADALMNMPMLRGMSFLDWTRGRELFDAAYAATSEALTQASPLPDGATDAARFDHIKQAAGLMEQARL